jgi:predicted RNA-binding Zn-ribbon protein involved in translation (DUF1610 family)
VVETLGRFAEADMTRFDCGQCGTRIVVAERHLGRLCRCPDCGGITHPLARQLDADRRVCENCGEKIGRLQQVKHWKGNVVCHRCHGAMSDELAPRRAALQSMGDAQALVPISDSAQTVLVTRSSADVRSMRASEAPTPALLAADLHAGAMGVLVGFGLMAAAFLLAMTLLSYIGLFVTILLFSLLGIMGVQRLWRGSAILRTRVLELKVARDQHGAGKMAMALAGSLRSRHPARVALGLIAMLLCSAMYVICSLVMRPLGRLFSSSMMG